MARPSAPDDKRSEPNHDFALFHEPSRTARRFPTAAARASLAALGMAAFLAAASPASAAQKEFATGTDWLTGTDWNPTGVPGAGDNVLIDAGSPGSTSATPYTITSGALTVEDLTDTATSATNFLSNIGSADSTLTLNGGRGSTVPLIEMGSTKSFTIQNGPTNALNLVLAASGSFDVANTGKLVVSSNIGETGGSRTLTITNASSFATPGVITFSGTNTFSGGLVITGTGDELDVTTDASLGAAGGSITINGARLGIGTNSFTVDATRNIFLGANPTGGNTTGTLSIKTSITTTFNQGFQNLNGTTKGDLVKQGGGTLQLGGVSTYSGNTFLNNGITQLTTGSNRLPTGTVVYLGQSTTNNGELDLNGQNQQVAGLNSVTGTNTGSSNTAPALNTNFVTTSTGASTLTLGGSGTYAYGDGSTQNSGVISGALSINKTGTGSQTFGGANTYTGSTTVSGGTLIAGTATSGSAVQALGGTSGVFVNGGGTLQMGAANQFNTATPAGLTLGGTVANAATFAVGGFNQGSTTAAGVGMLSLASGSAKNVIDFGSQAGVVSFLSLATNGATLTINNYLTNNGAAGGADELIFNQNESANLGKIVFTGLGTATEQLVSGTAGTASAFYEVFPSAASVPEPSTWAAMALGTLGLLAWQRFRRGARLSFPR